MLTHEGTMHSIKLAIVTAAMFCYMVWQPNTPGSNAKLVPYPAQEQEAPPQQLMEARTPNGSDRKYDIVVMGATGFIGSLSAAALLRVPGQFEGVPSHISLVTDQPARIALAARNRAKLEALRDKFTAAGANMEGVPLLIADLDDPDSLDAFVSDTKVVVSFAGRYWDGSTIDTNGYGRNTLTPDELVMKCALAGTHYLDGAMRFTPSLTRETDDLDGTSIGPTLRILDIVGKQTGAVISPATGCISVPHELTTLAALARVGTTARPRQITQYEIASYPSEGDELLRADGSNPYPFDMMFQPLERNITMVGEVPMQTSLMEALTRPVMKVLAAQMGWGEVPFHMYSPSNHWSDHYEYILSSQAAREFRRHARYLVVAEVEGDDGLRRVASLQYYEGLYEGSARNSVEMALALVFRPWAVEGATTGGVFTAGSGWGNTLVHDLKQLGITMAVEEPGTSAAYVVNRWMRAHGMLKGS